MFLYKVFHKIIIFNVFTFILLSCYQSQVINEGKYKIDNLSELNDWYIIYASQGDKKFKIVLKKIKDDNIGCKKIVIGKNYNLKIHSIKNNPNIEIENDKLFLINSMNIDCIKVDTKTSFCNEIENGIFDIFTVDILTKVPE